MERDVFYSKLIQSLAQSDFRFDPQRFSEDDANADHDGVTRSIRLAVKHAPSVVKALTHVSVPSSFFSLHAVFDQEGVRRELDSIREYVSVVCFKYVLSQPVIVACIEADRLSPQEAVEMCAKFDEAVLGMLKYTGKMGGITIGNFSIGGTKLSVMGILMYTFFDHAAATRFVASTQKTCKVLHFFKKSWLLPWVINVAGKEVIGHSGLPIITSQVINANRLKQALFHA